MYICNVPSYYAKSSVMQLVLYKFLFHCGDCNYFYLNLNFINRIYLYTHGIKRRTAYLSATSATSSSSSSPTAAALRTLTILAGLEKIEA